MTFSTELPSADTKFPMTFEPFMAAAFAPAMFTSAMMMEGYNFWWNIALGFGRDLDSKTKIASDMAIDVTPEIDAMMDGAANAADFDMLDEAEAVAAQEDAKAKVLELQAISETPTTAVPAGMKPAGLAAARDKGADDLSLISGIGRKTEQLLNELGIFHFDQISKWTEQEANWVDGYLNFKGRIMRDDWLAQADALAAGGREEYARRFGKEPR